MIGLWGDHANYTVRPVFARCLVLVARVVSRKHDKHFLGALILHYLGAHSRALAVRKIEMGLFVDSFPTTSL